MSMLSKLRLTGAALLACAVGTQVANASSWVVMHKGPIIPVPSFSSVNADTFHYGQTATIALGGFGATSAVFYKAHQWQGDSAGGSYQPAAQWSCQNLTQLNANNQSLVVPLASGRYKVDVVAVMADESCDNAAFTAGNLVTSATYTSNEFMVIGHDRLDFEVGGVAQSTLVQNPNPQVVDGYGWFKDNYNMHLTWPTIAGTENYQVTIVKDGVEYPLSALSDTAYANDLAINGHYKVVDTHDAATDTFSPYTGFGEYQYKLRYQMAGQWSNAITHTNSTLIEPAPVAYFSYADKARDNTLPPGVVELNWQADARTKYFMLREFPTQGGMRILEDRVPGPATIILERDQGTHRNYDHWLFFDSIPDDLSITYSYEILACPDKECNRVTYPWLRDAPSEGVSPVPTEEDLPQVLTTLALDASVVDIDDITHGEYEEASTGSNFGSKYGRFYSALEPGDGSTTTDTPVMNEDILNRLKVETEITPETTELLGEQVSLATGTATFTHTDVDIPGNSGLPVRLIRRLESGDLLFKNSRDLGDWQLDVPYIHTTLPRVRGNYVGPWGQGKACSGTHPEDFRNYWGATIWGYEYYNGMTLNVPGEGGGKLTRNSLSGGNFADTRYHTLDNWQIRCIKDTNGVEGFLATSPQGVKYTFNRARLVQGKPIMKRRKPTSKYDAFMLVTRVEDLYGNVVTYNYSATGGRLSSIVGKDAGSDTDRRIDLIYEGARLKTVQANGRNWQYEYDSNGYLTKVTRPDESFWQIEMQGFIRLKGFHQNSADPSNPGDQSCVRGAKDAPWTGAITHPNGARGEFTFNHLLGGRSDIPTIKTNNEYIIPRCFVTVGLVAKKLSGPGLDEMNWTYDYSESWGSRLGESGGHTKWTSVVAPDGSKTVHTFNRNMASVFEGKEIKTEYYDTNGVTLLKRVEQQYTGGRNIGVLDMLFDNSASHTNYSNNTQSKVTVFSQGNATSYITNRSVFNDYGVARKTDSYNTADNDHQYVFDTYMHNTADWVLNLKTTVHMTDDNANWPTTPVSETIYWSSGHANKYLPHVEKSFGAEVKRYTGYSNGNLTRVEFPVLMNDGNRRYQAFSNYKRGKAQTIKLPGRYNAASTMTANVNVNNNGWVTSVVNFNGERTEYSYDNMGRVTKVTPSTLGTIWSPTSLSFEPVGGSDIQGDVESGMYKHVKTTGSLKSISYLDALMRPVLVKTSDTANNIHTYQRKTFNAYNKPVFEAYPATNALESQGMRHAFDGLQRPISTTQTVTGAVQRTEYLSGHKTRVTDYNGNSTTTTFLAYGEPKTEQALTINSPEGVNTVQTVNLYGNVTTITQGGITEKRIYDARQRLCKQVRPETGITVFERDVLGSVTGLVKGSSSLETDCAMATSDAGHKISFTRDNLGANRTIDFQDESGDVTTTYDPQGNLSSLVAGEVTQTYSYLDEGVLKSEQLSVDGKTWDLSYTYNSLKGLKQMTYPDTTVMDFAPNAFGQPTKAGGYATGAKYFPDGQVQSFTFGNQLKHSKTLNASKMPKSLMDFKFGGLGSNVYAMQFDYTYDSMGNLTEQLDNIDSAYNITDMTYDGLDRLIAATGFWGNVSIGYDTLGNITNYNFTDKGNTSYAYDSYNRLTSVSGGVTKNFTYDTKGNVTDNGKNAFTYNHANRMTSSDKASYVYDGHGRRVKNARIMGDDYSFYDAAGRLVYREKADGTKVKYAFLAKLQVARIENGTTTKYVHTDLLGSPVVESDNTGSVLEATRMHYRPFGETKETPKDEVGYTGHMFDTDIGLVYAQQRYYDSEIGRFYADDPVDAGSFISQGNVQGFGRYTYVNNNPYKYVDPDGRFAWLLAPMVVGAIVGAVETAVFDFAAGKEFSMTNVMKGAGMGAIAGAVGGIGKAVDTIRKVEKAAKTMKELNENAVKSVGTLEGWTETGKIVMPATVTKTLQGRFEGAGTPEKQKESKDTDSKKKKKDPD